MATKFSGYMGKVMMIDLTTQEITEYPWSDRDRELFIGGKTMAELLRRPETDYESLTKDDPKKPPLDRRDASLGESEIKYAGYIQKQESAARRVRRMDERPLPADLPYKEIPGLRLEAAQKLAAVKPLTLGQAERISGVNPADITVLIIWLEQRKG